MMDEDTKMLSDILSRYGGDTPPLPNYVIAILDGIDEVSHFDMCGALYWYCCDYHSGEGSMEYQILSWIGFEPGPLCFGPETAPELEIYEMLASGEITPLQVLNEIIEYRRNRG